MNCLNSPVLGTTLNYLARKTLRAKLRELFVVGNPKGTPVALRISNPDSTSTPTLGTPKGTIWEQHIINLDPTPTPRLESPKENTWEIAAKTPRSKIPAFKNLQDFLETTRRRQAPETPGSLAGTAREASTATTKAKIPVIRNLHLHLAIANKKRSALSTAAVRTKQGLKHVSLAIRYKAYCRLESCQINSSSLLKFLEYEESVRTWNQGTRSTNWGNAIGMARRGEVFGLGRSWNPLRDQLFKDARHTVKVLSNKYKPRKPELLTFQTATQMVRRIVKPQIRLTVILATITGARISDTLQLEIEDFKEIPAVGHDALAITFRTGKVCDAIGPYTVATRMGPFAQWIREAIETQLLFSKRTEKQRDRFEAQVLVTIRKVNPTLGLRSFRNSFAQMLGHNFASMDELHHFLRHSTEKMTYKYLRDGQDFWYGLRTGYNAVSRCQQDVDDEDSSASLTTTKTLPSANLQTF